MCIRSHTNSTFCGVCVKLKSLLKLHFRLHHGKHAKTLSQQICQLFNYKALHADHTVTPPSSRRRSRRGRIPVKSDSMLSYDDDLDDSQVEGLDYEHESVQEISPIVKSEDSAVTVKGEKVVDGPVEDSDAFSDPIIVSARTRKRKSSPKMFKPSPSKRGRKKIKTIFVNVEKASMKNSNKTCFDCVTCKKKFVYHKALVKHSKLVHGVDIPTLNEIKIIEPVVEDENTPPDTSLEDSGLDHDAAESESKLDRSFPCHLCDKSYAKQRYLERHLKAAHGEYVPEIDDDAEDDDELNDETFEIKSEKRKSKTPRGPYVKKEKLSADDLTCNICEKEFKKLSELRKHLRTHTKEKPYLCEICGTGYAGASALAIHKKLHSGVDLVSCDICNKVFATKTRLLVHARIHSGEKPFHCEYCGRSFSNIGSLKPHLRTHTGEKPFKCDLCDYSSTVRAGLTQHMLNHGERTIYSCHLCDKKFRFKAKYKAHLIKHTGTRRHFCQLCNRGFFYANELKKHTNTVHSQARPFACQYCEQAYKRKTHLNRHMLSSHRHEIPPDQLPKPPEPHAQHVTYDAHAQPGTQHDVHHDLSAHPQQPDHQQHQLHQLTLDATPATTGATIPGSQYKMELPTTPTRTTPKAQPTDLIAGALSQTYNLTEQALQVMTHHRLDPATHAAAIEAALGHRPAQVVDGIRADNLSLRPDGAVPGLRLSVSTAEATPTAHRLMDLSHRPASVTGMVDTSAGGSQNRSHDATGARPATAAMETSYEVHGGVDWYVATTPDNMQIYVPRTLAHIPQ